MPIRYVLFDLDGTLLPMDQELFLKTYFGGLAQKLAPLGYDAEALFRAIWKGTGAMIKNDGSVLNQPLLPALLMMSPPIIFATCLLIICRHHRL